MNIRVGNSPESPIRIIRWRDLNRKRKIEPQIIQAAMIKYQHQKRVN